MKRTCQDNNFKGGGPQKVCEFQKTDTFPGMRVPWIRSENQLTNNYIYE